ncbi:MAG: hypothetical protein HZB51_21310 [Chloroflexi bacterium]|nr:hypothetical protein [Chloroflexota bacterium]
MALFDKIIQQTTERLYEDERMRSNFTDDEAKIVLGWAQNWITSQVRTAKTEAQAQQIAQSESTRVRQTVGTLNTLAAKPGALNLNQAIAALEPQVKLQQAMPREKVFKLLTEWVTLLWRNP